MLSNKSHRRTDRQLKRDEMMNIFNQVDKSVECFRITKLTEEIKCQLNDSELTFAKSISTC